MQIQPLASHDRPGFDCGRAEFDAGNTAILGTTGSGKTTLIDALMRLLCRHPRYNLVSTGGHKSDRDLVSYVRGASGPGRAGAGQRRRRPGGSRRELRDGAGSIVCAPR